MYAILSFLWKIPSYRQTLKDLSDEVQWIYFYNNNNDNNCVFEGGANTDESSDSTFLEILEHDCE